LVRDRFANARDAVFVPLSFPLDVRARLH